MMPPRVSRPQWSWALTLPPGTEAPETDVKPDVLSLYRTAADEIPMLVSDLLAQLSGRPLLLILSIACLCALLVWYGTK